jgi:hypothetical protein
MTQTDRASEALNDVGSNPRLDDRSPALLLHSMPLEEIQGPIAAAARAFAAR